MDFRKSGLIMSVFVFLFLTISPGHAEEKSIENSILVGYDFDNAPVNNKNTWRVMWNEPQTLFSIVEGDGAVGSKFYLKIGPHAGNNVGVSLIPGGLTFSEDSWIGFSARNTDESGEPLRVMIQVQKNTEKTFSFPKNGSWKTYRIPISSFGIAAGSQSPRITFYIDNGAKKSDRSFDLDNVFIGNGSGFSAPEAVTGLTAESKENSSARLAWSAPRAAGGISEYRVYRGLDGQFPRDEKHLIGKTEEAHFKDTSFTRKGTYYYAVEAVDFGENRGIGENIVSVEVR